jgi:CheY-like chemotaxis protein
LAIHPEIAESVDVPSDGRDAEALSKTGALQRAIFNSANFSSIATDAKGVIQTMILLDLKLPKVDGLEVLRPIKGDSALKMIPVVMMTSSREEQDLLHTYQPGVNAYVVKPMKFHDFVEAVRHVGAFWGVINDVPPGSVRHSVSVGS